ncbi:hypothetical protein Q7P37_008564 [Cladosporium fusiforme]
MQSPIPDHALIGNSTSLPTTPSKPTITLNPITLAVPSRPTPLQIRLTIPTPTSPPTALPIILLSHGHGKSNHLSSLAGYSPLSNFWASHGFAVLQPTHLSSRSLGLQQTGMPGASLFWRERVQDMVTILDRLDEIESAAAGVLGRGILKLDAERVAVVGHSLGGHTASVLLGMEFEDRESGQTVSLVERRIKAGILLAVPGEGDESLSEWGKQNLPFLHKVDFRAIATPALVVVGDADPSAHLTTQGWQWHADPYRLGREGRSLLTLFGGDHCLGGVSGYDAAETEGENPEMVAAVQRLSCAYLGSVLDGDAKGWEDAVGALHAIGSIGKVESK